MQISLYKFYACLIILILSPDFFSIHACCDIGILQSPVRLHYLTHIVHSCEKLTKVGGVQNQVEKAGITVFFHGPDACAVSVQLLGLKTESFLNLHVLFCDHVVV